MNKLQVFATVVLLLLIVSASYAQDSLGMRRVSTLEYWQGANDIQMVGDTAYVVSGESGMHIMDLSVPTNPVEIGRCTWYEKGDVTGGVHIVGNRAYIGTGAGLLVFDITDPARPERIAQYGNSDNEMEDIYVIGDLGIAVSGEGAPYILDLSDLQNIHPLSGFPGHDGSATVIGMADDYLLLSGWGLFVYNINDPTQPERVAVIDTMLISHYATMSGGYVYLSTMYDGVRIIDVSDPLNPVEVSQCDSGSCGGVTVAGNHLYVGKYDSISIWNITDPIQPEYTGAFPVQFAFPVNRITSSGNILCTAIREQPESVAVLDVSAPAEPVFVSSFGRRGFLTRMTIDGDIGYLAGGWTGGLCTFDFSDPTNILELGLSEETIYTWTYDVAIRGNYAYTPAYHDGVFIYDIGNPLNPDSVSCIPVQHGVWDEAWRVSVVNDFLYVIGDKICTFNLQDPEEPQLVDIVDYGVTDRGGFQVKDGFLYLGNVNVVRIYSLADPASPQFVGSITLPIIFGATICDLAIEDNYIYVAYWAGGLRIIDISDPTLPFEAAWTDGYVTRVVASGTTLIIDHLGFVGEIRVFDITNPISPIEVGYYITDEWLKQMTIVEPYLVTVAASQLRVYEVEALMNTEQNLVSIPKKFELFSCYPNPFNLSTKISFSLPQTVHAKLAVYDVAGRQVADLLNKTMTAGEHSLSFDGTALPSGVYFARLEAGQEMQTRKMVLIK